VTSGVVVVVSPPAAPCLLHLSRFVPRDPPSLMGQRRTCLPRRTLLRCLLPLLLLFLCARALLHPHRAMNAVNPPRGLLPELRRALVEVLVVGSVTRPAHLEATLAGLRAAGLTAHGFTERSLPLCVVCDDTLAWSQAGLYDTVDADLGVAPWTHKPRSWWCAQARPTAALLAYLQGYGTAPGSRKHTKSHRLLPAFLLVVDDDTFVHTARLTDLLAPLSNRAAPLYLGFAGHQFRDLPGGRSPPFCYGGAGYALNTAALLLLSTDDTLARCHAAKQGGRWCHFHSDWVVGQCLLRTLPSVPCDWTHGGDAFIQNVSLLPGGLAACARNSITCHGGLSADDLRRAYGLQ
jgi:hypothetical protein